MSSISAITSPGSEASFSQGDTQSNQFFPLIQLPTELRLQIYSYALGCKYTPKSLSPWIADCSAPPGGCMALLRCNRKIADEVRELLYPQRCFTVEISAVMMFFSTWDLREWLQPGTTIDRFETFRPLPSTGYIEHWQLDLQFRAPYTLSREMHRSLRKFRRWKRIDVDRIFIREGILEAVAQLAKLETLGSLKIKFPCFCSMDNTRREDYDDSWSPPFFDDLEVPDEEVIQLIHDVLEPLKTLCFQGPVMFIAAKPLPNSSQSVDSPKYQTEDIQCEQAACLAFVTKFDKLAEFLGRSSLPRAQLSAQHHTWLEIKHRAVKLSCGAEITESLLQLWTRAKFNRDVIGTAPGHKSNDSPRRAFTKAYKNASTNLKAAIKKEQLRNAEELKRVRSSNVEPHIQQAGCDCFPQRRCPTEDRRRELVRMLEIDHCGTRSFTSMRDAKAAVQRAVEGSEKDTNDRILECSR